MASTRHLLPEPHRRGAVHGFEPEDDFERYLNAVDPLLHPGRDVVWVLCGRTESNINKLRKVRLQVGDAIGV